MKGMTVLVYAYELLMKYADLYFAYAHSRGGQIMLKILPLCYAQVLKKLPTMLPIMLKNLPIMLKLCWIVMKGYMIMMITMKEIMIVEKLYLFTIIILKHY